MKILIAGTEINVVNVIGANMFVRGASGDTLELQFGTMETGFQALQKCLYK